MDHLQQLQSGKIQILWLKKRQAQQRRWQNTSNATTTDRAAVTADKPAETTVQPNSGATSDRAAAVEVEAKPETTAKPEVAAKPETATTSEVAANAGVAAPTTEKSKELSEAEIKAAVSLDNIKKKKMVNITIFQKMDHIRKTLPLL